MLFNSFEFALFLPAVFLLYWFVVNKNLRAQNLLIVAVSYLFYGWWDWRFLLLIAFTTAASYISGILIQRVDNQGITLPTRTFQRINRAKYIATANIVLNLAILCLFKYFNFFAENLAQLFRIFGAEIDWVTLDILLPVGISFYTFQALSYTIDVYKRKIEPTHDVVSFFAYVSFFPQLVAGPIERATNLLPQFYKKRQFDYALAVSGMRQILWGLFKKIVVADNCATIVNHIFDNPSNFGGSTLLLGGVLFAFQIYGDFSGYSDIAIGTARLFGFNLIRNFNFPYFSRDIAEFWRRWHISLNTWFRDYVYIPLGGSRRGTKIAIGNTFVIFLLSGMWHGANWTFIVWGAYHALLFLPLLLLGRNRKFTDTVAQDRWWPSIGEVVRMGVTFFLVVVGWIIFRADSLSDAISYIGSIFEPSLFTKPSMMDRPVGVAIFVMLAVEWVGRRGQFALHHMPRSVVIRFALYVAIVFAIIIFGNFGHNQFIYFQF